MDSGLTWAMRALFERQDKPSAKQLLLFEKEIPLLEKKTTKRLIPEVTEERKKSLKKALLPKRRAVRRERKTKHPQPKQRARRKKQQLKSLPRGLPLQQNQQLPSPRIQVQLLRETVLHDKVAGEIGYPA